MNSNRSMVGVFYGDVPSLIQGLRALIKKFIRKSFSKVLEFGI